MLLLLPISPLKSIMASFLGLGFLFYLLLSKKFTPNRPCGCLSNSEQPISWRSIIRAVYLFLITLFCWSASGFWYLAVITKPGFIALALFEMLIFILLSPELDALWKTLINYGFQWKLSLTCAMVKIQLSEILLRLQENEVYKSYSTLLTSTETDFWRDGCWYFVCYNAEYHQRSVLAIFAIPVLKQTETIRAAIVDDIEREILFILDPMDVESIRLPQAMAV